MSQRLVAVRYAKALLEIGRDQDSLVGIQKDLDAIDALVRGNADLERLCLYPLIAPSKKAAAFDAVLLEAGVGQLLRRFFRVVAESARLYLIHEITEAFRSLVDHHMGIVEAQVASAQVLTPAQTESLRLSLSKRTGKTIRLACRQDAALLGGLKVQVGSTIYDASLQGQLQQLKARLLSA